ncbi:AcrB/AcrD/AcrF family protein [Prosthecobacter fusiformis]|uniref:AcrB/AcrD/AcrF family protein n=1 Tax=Prosthecobacter fusiformis TaxID=48464 RepID=A0A4R7SPU2_9BACT|nr:efflux RND transporter permease subunit [Prosthecobacter fusiformis]TDU81232.1 AcrB/AcrD/AcrF family protein [Prosthecobacter fusiformis]
MKDLPSDAHSLCLLFRSQDNGPSHVSDPCCLKTVYRAVLSRLMRKSWLVISLLVMAFGGTSAVWHTQIRNGGGFASRSAGLHALTVTGLGAAIRRRSGGEGSGMAKFVMSKRAAGVVLAAAVLLVFGAVAAAESWRVAVILSCTTLFSLVGCVMANWLGNGGGLSWEVLTGFLMVLVLATLQGVQQVRHYRLLEKEIPWGAGTRLALRGAEERLTCSVTMLLFGLIAVQPFVLNGGSGPHSIAVAVLGGLIAATVATLFFLPVLYARHSHVPYWKQIICETA